MMVEPLQIPMLGGRIAIAAVALTHALFATFIVGSSVIGAVTETVGYATGRARYERLSRLIAFLLVLSTATVSFMGITLVFALNIYWPHFWSTLFRIMFWPLLLEAFLFLGEAVFAYAWYYSWEWGTGNRKRLHLILGWLTAACALIAMVIIDSVASFMLTPTALDHPWDRIFNPTMMHLDLHRIFGNLTWAGFGLAGLCAIGWLRSKETTDRLFFQWAGSYAFMIGFGALLVMPIIGYQYLLQLRYTQPQTFQTLMLGERSWLFDLVALLFGLLIVFASGYVLHYVRGRTRPADAFDSFLPISLAVVILAALVLPLPYHLQHIPGMHWLTDREINPLGKMQPNKYLALAALVTFGAANFIVFLRSYVTASKSQGADRSERAAPILLIALAVCSILIMLGMGWVRETARASNGYLIYGKMRLSDERSTYEAPR